MKKCAFIFIVLLLSAATALATEGVISVKSAHGVNATADRLVSILKNRGMTVFARIDHARGAQKVGISLRPTVLVIFGNPKVGSLLMACASTTALDFPQKALVWQDKSGQVWLSYNDPAYIARRHGIGECAKDALAKVTGALNKFTHAAAAP